MNEWMNERMNEWMSEWMNGNEELLIQTSIYFLELIFLLIGDCYW